MKAVIYARYSSDNQREESIEGQIRECMEYAERNDITVLCNYIDRAMSARTADRPEFQRMIRDSEKHLFDVVLVWKLDRFSRDRYDSAHYKHILKKNGVKVLSAKENISDGPEGIILESMLEGYAEYYSAELSQKIHRGQKENALKCRNNGGNIPLGYVVGPEGVLVVDPLTAPLVKEIFTMYDEGKTISEITKTLNQRGLKTRKGFDFRIGSISLILKNRKYIGEYRYQDVVIPNGVPALVDEELFNRAQEKLVKNKQAPARYKAPEEYLLTTKLFCGDCGRMMAGESGTSATKSVKYCYYKCGGAKRKLGCKRKPLKKDWIERAAVLVTVNRVLKDEEIDRIANAIVALQEREDPTLPALNHQLAECEKAIENMLNAIQMGILTESTKERLEQLEEQKKSLKQSILQTQIARPRYTKPQIVNWISRFKYGNVNDPEYQRQIIDIFINAIYVFDDKLAFTYNFHDGTETITLKEIEAAFGSDLSQVAPPSKTLDSSRVFPCFGASSTIVSTIIEFQTASDPATRNRSKAVFLCSSYSILADQLLQLVGGLLLHVLVGMAVYIQREGNRGMSQGFRERFGIDVALQGQSREGVADIVKAYLGAAHFLHNFLEVDVQRLEPHETPILPGEDHVVLVFPAAAGAEPHFALLPLGFLQHVQGGGGGHIHHLPLIRAGGDADKLAVHPQGVLVKIHAVPTEADQLAFPQAGEEIEAHHQIIQVVLRQLHELSHLFLAQRIHFMLDHPGQLAVAAHVPAKQLHLDRLVQHPVQHAVNVVNALGRQALPFQLIVQALDGQCGQILHFDVTDVGYDMKPEVGVVVIHGRMLHAVRLEIVQPLPAPLLHRQIGFRDGNALADLRAFGG